MVSAYVLIKVGRAKEMDTSENIKKLAGVQDVAVVYGEYDNILKVEKKTMEDLQDFLVKTLRNIPGVIKTSTLIVSD